MYSRANRSSFGGNLSAHLNGRPLSQRMVRARLSSSAANITFFKQIAVPANPSGARRSCADHLSLIYRRLSANREHEQKFGGLIWLWVLITGKSIWRVAVLSNTFTFDHSCILKPKTKEIINTILNIFKAAYFWFILYCQWALNLFVQSTQLVLQKANSIKIVLSF